jgi:ABC-type Fe3+-siderophore transport system permease subunit
MPEETAQQPPAPESTQSSAQPEPQPQTTPATPLVTSQAGAFAVSALVIGIVATFSSWIPIWGVLVGSTALVLGIVALKKNQNKALAITGIVTGGLATVLSLFITAVFVLAFSSEFNDSRYDYDDNYNGSTNGRYDYTERQ